MILSYSSWSIFLQQVAKILSHTGHRCTSQLFLGHMYETMHKKDLVSNETISKCSITYQLPWIHEQYYSSCMFWSKCLEDWQENQSTHSSCLVSEWVTSILVNQTCSSQAFSLDTCLQVSLLPNEMRSHSLFLWIHNKDQLAVPHQTMLHFLCLEWFCSLKTDRCISWWHQFATSCHHTMSQQFIHQGFCHHHWCQSHNTSCAAG